jgi:hypothetical protein
MFRVVIAVALVSAACGGSSKECDTEVGHDEDGDGMDDGCDPCPYADDNVLDEDGDGLAGVCDPDPIAKNHVVKFIGFGAEDSELTLIGDGAISGDAFHITGGSQAGAVLWGTGLDRVWVVAGIDVTAIDPTGFREVGVIVDAATVAQSMLPNGTYCAVGVRDVPEAGTDYIEVGVRQQPATDETLVTDQAVLYLEGLKQAVVQSFHDTSATPSLSCAFGVPGNRALIAGTRMPAPSPGPVGLFGFAVDAKYSFLMIVSSE